MSDTRTARPDRRSVVVTGAGVLSPLGYRRDDLFRALLRGERGLRPVTLFETRQLVLPRAGELNGDGPEQYLQGRNLRPLDRTGRLAAAAAELALDDSGFRRHHRPESGEGEDKEEAPLPAGLVLGTMFGSVRTISEFDRRGLTAGPQYTKPFDFANSVINAAAGQAAIWHGLAGINATFAGGTTAGLGALAHATDLIRAGRIGALLAGGAEELSFEACWGFARAGLLAEGDPPAVPFHARRHGFLPGEGAALLMLEEQEAAAARGADVLGRLVGSGSSFDPSRGDDPESAAAAVRRAVEAALHDAGRAASDVDALSTSASGGRVDGCEARGLAAVFGERAAELPVTAVKGALGEGLGASAALQTLVLLEAMAAGELPGIPGLDEPEPDLPLTVGPANRKGELRCGLVTSLSWDGHAWALVVEAP